MWCRGNGSGLAEVVNRHRLQPILRLLRSLMPAVGVKGWCHTTANIALLVTQSAVSAQTVDATPCCSAGVSEVHLESHEDDRDTRTRKLRTSPPHSSRRGTRKLWTSSLPSVSAGVGDLSLPLSSFFSRPVSELVTLLQSALTSTPSPSPTLTSVGTCSPQGPTVPTTRVSRQSLPARVHVPARRTPVAAPTASSSDWSRTLSPIDIAPFVQPVGPTVPIPQSPVEVFNLFFTDEICTLIVEQTNLYAEQNLGEDERDKVTVEELRAYFGFKIMMGLVPLPAVDDYWRRDPLFHYAPIADRISRKRFREITCYLHYADNTHLPQPGEPGYDRLGKVRGIMGKVQEQFTALYKPHCECAIDEAMIPFQGRSSLKQYMPAKPVKRGIKVWCLADAHNRYMCETQVYEGKAVRWKVHLAREWCLTCQSSWRGKSTTSFSPPYLSSPLCVTGVSMPKL